MNRGFSIYLDLVRFVAACLVYIYHSNQRLLVKDVLPASTYGHTAVIVFFVLSGFVIAYITDTKEKEWSDYAASRLSRIYSVALPAVVLTIGLDFVGRQLYPALYAYPFDQFFVRGVASLLMLNEIWFVSITSFSNVPYWSIGYEMWYYLCFGLLVFLPPGRGALLAIMALLLAGPKVVLLAPIWAAGVALHRWKAITRVAEPVAWCMALASAAAIVWFHWVDVTDVVADHMKAWIGLQAHRNLTFSKFFPSDYILGALVFINFASMRKVCERIAPALTRVERPIRTLAAYTLTLYLLHQPLFLFWAAVIRGDPTGHAYWWQVTALVAVSVALIGHVTESRRQVLKRLLQAWIEVLPSRLGRVRA